MKRIPLLIALGAAVMVATVSVTAQTQKSWADEDLDKLMKEVGPASGAMRKAIDGQNAELAKTNATKLNGVFTDVAAFWTARNVKEAAEIAGEAAKHAKAAEGAIDAKDFTKAAEHAKLLQGACASCHGKFRDKGPDGMYRIKP